jgi:hypothetical protein
MSLLSELGMDFGGNEVEASLNPFTGAGVRGTMSIPRRTHNNNVPLFGHASREELPMHPSRDRAMRVLMDEGYDNSPQTTGNGAMDILTSSMDHVRLLKSDITLYAALGIAFIEAIIIFTLVKQNRR